MYPVWAVADDGPCAGAVFEVDVNEKNVELRADAVYIYRRLCWGTERAHRIAHYAFVKAVMI
jgi:hypothetical protein